MRLKQYITEEIDMKKLEKSLEVRINKVSERASKLSDARYKLVDEIEKIQKKMKKHGIKELRYVRATDDPHRVVGDMMA